jgi:hypothetical protein
LASTGFIFPILHSIVSALRALRLVHEVVSKPLGIRRRYRFVWSFCISIANPIPADSVAATAVHHALRGKNYHRVSRGLVLFAGWNHFDLVVDIIV